MNLWEEQPLFFPHFEKGKSAPTLHSICKIPMSYGLSHLWFPQRWAFGLQKYFSHSISSCGHNVTTHSAVTPKQPSLQARQGPFLSQGLG